MKFQLDENGVCLPDMAIPAFIEKALASRSDIHVANMLALDVFRANLIQVPIEERPAVEWEIYGKPCKFDEYVRSLDAWDDKRMQIGEDALCVILGAVLEIRKGVKYKTGNSRTDGKTA